MIRKFLPTIVRNPLWGNREKYGLNVDVNDKDWMAWLNFRYKNFIFLIQDACWFFNFSYFVYGRVLYISSKP